MHFCFNFLEQRAEERPEANGEVASKAQKKFEDVVDKTVRVIANASISQDIGETIARSDECIELLLQVLGKWLNRLSVSVSLVSVSVSLVSVSVSLVSVSLVSDFVSLVSELVPLIFNWE